MADVAVRETSATTGRSQRSRPQSPWKKRRTYHAETRPPARPRTDYGPPAGYTPIVLPGESISKYRNLSQQPATEPKDEDSGEQSSFAPVEDFNQSGNSNAHAGAAVEEAESSTELERGYAATEPEQVEQATSSSAQGHAGPAETFIRQKETEQSEAAPRDDDREKWESRSAASLETVHTQPEAHSPESVPDNCH